MKKSYYLNKRILDIVMSSALLIIISPLLFIISLLVLLILGSPVLFKQKRPGKNKKLFSIYKFRTMRNEKDSHGVPLPDAKRMTTFGEFLRRTSIDELPELLNVLKGEMSLVGPRPLLDSYLERYSEEQARRHDVKPGITGWAQVNGRNALSWDEKFNLDIWYVDNCSMGLDIKILFMTMKKVVIQEGISQEGQSTMEEFMGSKMQEKNE